MRDVWFGRVWRAVPGRVLSDSGDEAALWVPRGSECVYPVDGTGVEIRLPCAEYRHARRRLLRDAVVLYREGNPWTLWHFYDEAGRFDSWYVNFELILGRRVHALDGSDHKLDLLAYPDGTHRLKDEDELEHAGAIGLLDPLLVRANADRALADPPWPTGWEDWRPDPGWPIPSLPAGWDVYDPDPQRIRRPTPVSRSALGRGRAS